MPLPTELPPSDIVLDAAVLFEHPDRHVVCEEPRLIVETDAYAGDPASKTYYYYLMHSGSVLMEWISGTHMRGRPTTFRPAIAWADPTGLRWANRILADNNCPVKLFAIRLANLVMPLAFIDDGTNDPWTTICTKMPYFSKNSPNFLLAGGWHNNVIPSTPEEMLALGLPNPLPRPIPGCLLDERYNEIPEQIEWAA